jgi:hypothetical protein
MFEGGVYGCKYSNMRDDPTQLSTLSLFKRPRAWGILFRDNGRGAASPTEMDDFLPHCEGPKLNRFVHSERRIQFRRLLSQNGGLHSHVFEVAIDRKRYALKIVRI